MESNPYYEHIMHCSPCYAEFLGVRERVAPPRDPSYRMPRWNDKKLAKMMDLLEVPMREVATSK